MVPHLAFHLLVRKSSCLRSPPRIFSKAEKIRFCSFAVRSRAARNTHTRSLADSTCAYASAARLRFFSRSYHFILVLSLACFCCTNAHAHCLLYHSRTFALAPRSFLLVKRLVYRERANVSRVCRLCRRYSNSRGRRIFSLAGLLTVVKGNESWHFIVPPIAIISYKEYAHAHTHTHTHTRTRTHAHAHAHTHTHTRLLRVLTAQWKGVYHHDRFHDLPQQ